MMKPNISYVVLALLVIANRADARPRPSEASHKHFEANKTFGLGLELGEPDGINGKYFIASDRALDFGIGDIYDYYSYRGIYLYGDYLWHPLSLASADAFELPFYIGAGISYWNWEDYRFGPRYRGNGLGVRVPVGISFDFNNVPLDIFIQLVPTVNLFYDRPSTYDRTLYLIIEGSVGIRYWFK